MGRNPMIFREPPENFQPKFYVVSCFIEHDGKFVMLLRNDDKAEGNKWGMPAGKRDVGESALGALIREVKEETSIDLPAERIGRSTPVYVRYPDYDFVFHIFHTAIDRRPDVIINHDEHKDFRWVTPDEAYEIGMVLDGDQCVELFYGPKVQQKH